VQDPAAVALPDGRVLLMGGLDSADVSVAGVELAGSGQARTAAAQLPSAVHDASAAPAPGGGAYLFGGGEPSRDAILRVTATGRATTAGRLPAPASDVAAAALGGSFYVVGGYTGTKALRTIVAWRPGSAARVVARLPVALRYAAVATAGGRLVIAGGSDGTTAGRAVYAFDPVAGSVRRIATLPRPLAHAAAVTLGPFVYVLGGRGATTDSQTRRVLSIDPRTGSVRSAGRLPHALSDAGAAATGGAIVLAGGRDAAGQVRSEVLRLEPR
jgi:Kelch motif